MAHGMAFRKLTGRRSPKAEGTCKRGLQPARLTNGAALTRLPGKLLQNFGMAFSNFNEGLRGS